MVLEDYVLYEPVGFSSVGPIWRAVGSDGYSCAVQIIDSQVASTVVSRVERLKNLGSPHLLQIKQIRNLPDGRSVVFSELLEGQDLEVLWAGTRLSTAQLNFLAYSMAQALGCLHNEGLFHGDISRSNIMLTSQGRVVLVDLLGIQDGFTSDFAAPERFRQGSSAPSDVYALGRVLLSLGMESDLLEGVFDSVAQRRPTANDLIKRWESLPKENIGLLSESQLCTARMRAAGRDVSTQYVSSPRNKPARNSRVVSKNTVETSRKVISVALGLRVGIVVLGVSVAVMFGILAAPVVLAQSGSYLYSQSSEVKTGSKLSAAVVPSESEFSTVRRSEIRKQVGARRSGMSNDARQSVSSLEPKIPLDLLAPEIAVNSQITDIESDFQAEQVLQELLARRVRALVKLDAKGLASTSVKDSVLAQDDQKLLTSLINSGSQIEGLTMSVKDTRILQISSDKLRLSTAITQGSYTQVDKAGHRHQISAILETPYEVNLAKDPSAQKEWRLTGILRTNTVLSER